MKMEMYDDAYTHCTECIRLDPTFDKVSYVCSLLCTIVGQQGSAQDGGFAEWW